jgi:BMFP domain-containing protein YqiC
MIADFAQRLLQELNKTLPQISTLLPQRELQQALQSACQRLDLVTREEFDAQAAVLQRTREKLERLEQRLAHMDSTEPK